MDASQGPATGVSVVAGYIGSLDAWEALDNKWRIALNEWRLEQFRLSSLPYLLGRDTATLCEAYFTNIIKSSELHAVGAVVFNEDWQNPNWGTQTSPRVNTVYKQCLNMALDTIADEALEHYPTQDVATLLCPDENEQYIEKAFMQKSKTYSKVVSLSSLSIGRSGKFLPLQAADLGAGVLRRNWSDIAQHKTADDSALFAMNAMPKGDGMRSRITIWSLRQGEIISRAWQAANRRREDGQD